MKVLEHYEIVFKETGGEQSIRCPVHEDSSPSCSLNIDKGLWHCHACQEAGDAITIIKLREEVDFETALSKYQEITGGSGSGLRKGVRKSVVPPGQGYKPRINKRLPAGVRKRTDFGS